MGVQMSHYFFSQQEVFLQIPKIFPNPLITTKKNFEQSRKNTTSLLSNLFVGAEDILTVAN
jgi:hypothetical protein